MSNNYLQFSEVLDNTTVPERAWLDSVRTSAGYSLVHADLRAEYPDLAPEVLSAAFEFKHQDDGTWIYADEWGDPETVGLVLHVFLRKFRPTEIFRLTWAEYCSRLLTSEFSGGVLLADASGYVAVNASDLRALSLTQLRSRLESQDT